MAGHPRFLRNCSVFIRTLKHRESNIKKTSRCLYTAADNYKINPVDQTTGLPPRYNIGLFGAGRIAKSVHLKNITSNHRFSLQWIVDDAEKSLASIKDGSSGLYLPETKFFRIDDTRTLLQDPCLDAVIVTSPTSSHADLVLKALRAGKSVMVEKPCGENQEEIRQCYDEAEKAKKILLTGFQRNLIFPKFSLQILRFDTSFQDLKQILQQQLLGEVKMMRMTSRDSPKPSYEFLKGTDVTGCNAISDMAVHDIDTFVWLTSGARPISVYSTTHAHDSIMREIGQPDIALIVVQCEDGLISTIDIDRDSIYGYDIRIEVYGSEGMTTVENRRESSSITNHKGGASLPRMFNSFPDRFEKAFIEELQHFVDCLDGKTQPLVTKDECLLTQKIVDKGIESFLTGQVVKF